MKSIGPKWNWKAIALFLFLLAILAVAVFNLSYARVFYKKTELIGTIEKVFKPSLLPLDIEAYDKKLENLANNPIPTTPVQPEGEE